MSGECLRGSYAHRSEFARICLFYPDVWRYIGYPELDVLNRVEQGEIDDDYVPNYLLWGHGNLRDQKQTAPMNDTTVYPAPTEFTSISFSRM